MTSFLSEHTSTNFLHLFIKKILQVNTTIAKLCMLLMANVVVVILTTFDLVCNRKFCTNIRSYYEIGAFTMHPYPNGGDQHLVCV